MTKKFDYFAADNTYSNMAFNKSDDHCELLNQSGEQKMKHFTHSLLRELIREEILKSDRPNSRNLVLVNDGSFNPPHRGHVNVTLSAAAAAKKMGYKVVGLYMCPNHPKWLEKKFKDRREILPSDDRFRLLQSVTAETGIVVSDWELMKPTWQSSQEYKRYFESKHPGALFVRVIGEDYGQCTPMPCFEMREGVWFLRLPRTERLSSTLIRKLVNSRNDTSDIAYKSVSDYMKMRQSFEN